MTLDNYPPGHPQGYTQELVTIICPNCGTSHTMTYEIEHSTGSGSFVDETTCENLLCKKDLLDVVPEEWQ